MTRRVREAVHLEAAGAVLQPVHVGGPRGVIGERLADGQRLVREQCRRVRWLVGGAPVDRDVHAAQGAASETGQSLPQASRAPKRSREANTYCWARAPSERKGSVSRSMA